MNTDCVISRYAKNSKGYAQYTYKGKLIPHHRLVYCLHNGIELDAIKGLVIMHLCDTPGCINPDHLKLGTHASNIADREAKGRGTKGEKHGTSKLTADDVRKIRKTAGTTYQIAEQFGISRVVVCKIINRELWKSVE